MEGGQVADLDVVVPCGEVDLVPPYQEAPYVGVQVACVAAPYDEGDLADQGVHALFQVLLDAVGGLDVQRVPDAQGGHVEDPHVEGDLAD